MMSKELLMWNMLVNEVYNILENSDVVLYDNPNKTLIELYNDVEFDITNKFNTMTDDEFTEYVISWHGEDYIKDVFMKHTSVDNLKYELEKYKVQITK